MARQVAALCSGGRPLGGPGRGWGHGNGGGWTTYRPEGQPASSVWGNEEEPPEFMKPPSPENELEEQPRSKAAGPRAPQTPPKAMPPVGPPKPPTQPPPARLTQEGTVAPLASQRTYWRDDSIESVLMECNSALRVFQASYARLAAMLEAAATRAREIAQEQPAA